MQIKTEIKYNNYRRQYKMYICNLNTLSSIGTIHNAYPLFR
jgi:hypothetical protein